MRETVLPLHRARPKLEELCAQVARIEDSEFLPDGSIRSSHRGNDPQGRLRFCASPDPRIYFGYDTRYLQKRRVAQHVKLLHEKMFAPCARPRSCASRSRPESRPPTSDLIDRDPLLASLQAEWRAFFAAKSYGGVRFLNIAAIRDCYDDEDAFDACHYFGPTAKRLGKRLANELDDLERSPHPAASTASCGQRKPRTWEKTMIERWKKVVLSRPALLAILFAQVAIYWTIAIYKLMEAVPVAYQRF